MTSVTLTIPPETANCLRQKASRDGLSLESYLLRLAEREADAGNRAIASSDAIGPITTRGPDLPLWDGTVLGTLSRQELYDDVD
jgi:hypothetical protein